MRRDLVGWHELRQAPSREHNKYHGYILRGTPNCPLILPPTTWVFQPTNSATYLHPYSVLHMIFRCQWHYTLIPQCQNNLANKIQQGEYCSAKKYPKVSTITALKSNRRQRNNQRTHTSSIDNDVRYQQTVPFSSIFTTKNNHIKPPNLGIWKQETEFDFR